MLKFWHVVVKGLIEMNGDLRPFCTERLGLHLTLTPIMDENAFYIELYRKTQTLGVNRPLTVPGVFLRLVLNIATLSTFSLCRLRSFRSCSRVGTPLEEEASLFPG